MGGKQGDEGGTMDCGSVDIWDNFDYRHSTELTSKTMRIERAKDVDSRPSDGRRPTRANSLFEKKKLNNFTSTAIYPFKSETQSVSFHPTTTRIWSATTTSDWHRPITQSEIIGGQVKKSPKQIINWHQHPRGKRNCNSKKKMRIHQK